MMCRLSGVVGVTLLSLAAIALTPAHARAQWAFLGEQDKLKGKTVVDVGELRREAGPTRTTTEYDYSENRYVERERRGEDYYRFDGGLRTVCIDEASGSDLGSSESALLLQDDHQVVYVAVLEASIGSVRVRVESVMIIRCP